MVPSLLTHTLDSGAGSRRAAPTTESGSRDTGGVSRLVGLPAGGDQRRWVVGRRDACDMTFESRGMTGPADMCMVSGERSTKLLMQKSQCGSKMRWVLQGGSSQCLTPVV